MLAREVERAVGAGQDGIIFFARDPRPLRPGAARVRHVLPRHRHRPRHFVLEFGVNSTTALARPVGALRRRKIAELLGDKRVIVGADQDALVAVEARRRIPDLSDIPFGPGNPAVDAGILFPEAPVGLPGELAGLDVERSANRRGRLLREVALDIAQDRQRNRADTVIGLGRRLRAARSIAIDDARPVAGAPDLRHLGAVGDAVADPALERGRDAVHAADRLKHRRLQVELVEFMHLPRPEVRIEQDRQVDRRARLAGLQAGARRRRVAGPARAAIDRVLVEIAETPEKDAEALFVARRERVVERGGVERLGQQLGDVAAKIVVQRARFDRLAVEPVVVVEQAPRLVLTKTSRSTPNALQ